MLKNKFKGDGLYVIRQANQGNYRYYVYAFEQIFEVMSII